jgi:hypothetical protein
VKERVRKLVAAEHVGRFVTKVLGRELGANKVFACVGAQQTLIELPCADMKIVTGSPS